MEEFLLGEEEVQLTTRVNADMGTLMTLRYQNKF
jgi:hypothetical protein